MYPKRKASTPVVPRDALAGLRKPGGSAWALWVLGYMLGGTLGSLIGHAITSLLSPGATASLGETASLPQIAASVVGTFVWGAILGTANWLVLSRYMKNIAFWPLLTGVGLALGSMLASLGFPVLFPGVVNLAANDPLVLLSQTADGALIGLVIGLMQATILLRRVSDTWGIIMFVATSGLGWLGLILVDYFLLQLVSGGQSTDPVLSIVILFIGFALAGLLSGYEVPSLIARHQEQLIEEKKPDAHAPAARSD
jgi:hypothetical protein